MVVVTINYRLNIFAFGDLESDRNLALRDQQRAFDYVGSHISGFGGDPVSTCQPHSQLIKLLISYCQDNITIAGESAGAVFCHAHVLTGVSVRQCILQSGTLHLSPPQPRAMAEKLIAKIQVTVKDLSGENLRSSKVSTLLEAQAKLGLQSFTLQEEDRLEGWREKTGDFHRLLIGDTEYEVSRWY